MPVAHADSADARRTRIADAALELLARQGARGLTHRAVDAQLALPSGSTSYYFRTRAALLMAAAERMLALDMADLERVSEDTAGVAKLLDRWLSARGRARALARMELLLAAARDPELAFMVRARERFIERAVQALRAAQPERDPDAHRTSATALIALVDGLTLHGLVAGAPSRDQLQRMLALRGQGPRPAKKKAAAKQPGRKLRA